VRAAAAGYNEIFTARGSHYNRATRLCPAARETERRLLLDLLPVRAGELVCDVPAGGGYVAEGIDARGEGARSVCLEPAVPFALGIPAHFPRVASSLERLALATAAVDHVASLAGLHHLDDKGAFFAEARRVLRPGGRLAVADVVEGSDVARFLNGPVDRLSVTGHDGKFLAHGELSTLLGTAGFRDIQEREQRYTWDFPDVSTLVTYFRELFGLLGAGDDEIRAAAAGGLEVDVADGAVRVSWGLVYAVGSHPG
jgi:SAM-dependent methyltransferase